ncbi:MAG: hypothetical protein A2991_01075 [Candidatus Terrybacteria bacterium RIFCSPLOWO2_01_FULL_58_14]|uniref:Large ribosomal subunit protein bL25 n=2 Tax=Candidatus Terryibacteriota TaxID=1817920 RepID=A0A1G2PXH8_9BACT|nr:MAG: hypothetical protein A2682_01625 [Candidatus Terrybacteria bacterium RIFCSPHIGHO2_01_FULL_58_15]OHA52302.1 MAG: hypothetical protein A2991_01075 [Candidatus Terrybacteria bacterium RIFCSPLOWO2_01_FULL_58_14]
MRELKVVIREAGHRLATLRNAGQVPAVLYGPDVPATPVSVPYGEFERAFAEVGESSLLRLEVSDDTAQRARPYVVLIRDVQRDPVRNTPVHFDFHAVRLNEALRIAVPIRFHGASSVESRGEGVLVKELHELEVEALPEKLPHEIDVDISGLASLNQVLHVSSLSMPEGVRVVTDSDAIIARTEALISEAEIEALETPPEETVGEVEVVGKKGEGQEEGEQTVSGEEGAETKSE